MTVARSYAVPSWYLPRVGPDAVVMAKPAHIPFLELTQQMQRGHGPDVDVDKDAPGGGQVYGGGYVKGQPGWRKTAGGWWVNLAGCLPQHMYRMDRCPRVTTWEVIPGAFEGHEWIVPVLLKPVPVRSKNLVLVSNLDQLWIEGKWQDDPATTSLLTRLLTVAHGGPISLQPEVRPVIELCADIISLGHQCLTMAELEATGWISQTFFLQLILTAAGLKDYAHARHAE